MEQQNKEQKHENVAMYFVYAAAAYFGLQLFFKPKRASAAATVMPYNTAASTAVSPASVIVDPVANTSNATVKTTSWIAESFPLRKGMKGANVKALQQKLGIIADGKFGSDTESVVMQQYGTSTVSKAQLQAIGKQTTSSPAVKAATWIAERFPLGKGMKGASVKVLQQKLGVNADGAFGNNTEVALMQKFGVNTVSKELFLSMTQPLSTTVNKILNALTPKINNTGTDTSPVLKSGSRGQDVYRLQKWLGFKDKKVAKKGDRIADSIFGSQTLTALQKKTGQSFISVNQLNSFINPLAGLGLAGEIIITTRTATIYDSNLVPHRSVPCNTILGKRLMELTDPDGRKQYIQFQTVDGYRRWVEKDAA